jgi:hypothetical protein
MTADEYLSQLAEALRRVAALQAAVPKPAAVSKPAAEQRRFPPGAAAKGGQNAAPRHRQYADEAYAHLYDELARWRAEGLSLAAIAAELNARGEPLRYMGTLSAWSPTQVARVLQRGERLRSERAVTQAEE